MRKIATPLEERGSLLPFSYDISVRISVPAWFNRILCFLSSWFKKKRKVPFELERLVTSTHAGVSIIGSMPASVQISSIKV